MLTNYNYYVLNAVTLSAFTLGSSLYFSLWSVVVVITITVLPDADMPLSPNSSSTRNPNIIKDKFGITKLYPIKL
jgi:hypothetical protein